MMDVVCDGWHRMSSHRLPTGLTKPSRHCPHSGTKYGWCVVMLMVEISVQLCALGSHGDVAHTSVALTAVRECDVLTNHCKTRAVRHWCAPDAIRIASARDRSGAGVAAEPRVLRAARCTVPSITRYTRARQPVNGLDHIADACVAVASEACTPCHDRWSFIFDKPLLHGRHCRLCAYVVVLYTDRQPDANTEHGNASQPLESKHTRSEVGVGGVISMAGAMHVV